MPRFVRPAWIEVRGDYSSPERGTGPRTRNGRLSARVTLRTALGSVSDAISFEAGGQDDMGRALMVMDIPAGMSVEIDGTFATGYHVVIRP